MEINCDYDDAETSQLASKFAAEVADRVVDAFNEGFILGVKHAHKVYGDDEDEQD